MVKIEDGLKLDFQDVLIRPKRSKLKSRSEVSLVKTYTFCNAKTKDGKQQKWTGIPIIAANMDTTGTFEMAKAFSKFQAIVAMHKHYSIDAWVKFAEEEPEIIKNNVAVSSGTSDRDFKMLQDVIGKIPQIPMICLDIANGYSEHFVQYVEKVRKEFPNHIIFAGNVVTGEMTEQLILSGADVVKVGIGPGSVCTTRKKTGVGYPQLSAVLECADAAHGLGGQVISDGGCTMPGDFAKAFGGGADFVMAGGMFAGTDESAGDLITEGDCSYKLFYGMSSDTAMQKYAGGVANYRASEGKTVKVPYKGPVGQVLQNITGGIRSACTYTGSKNLKELPKRCTFIRCRSMHHNVVFGDEKGRLHTTSKQNSNKRYRPDTPEP